MGDRANTIIAFAAFVLSAGLAGEQAYRSWKGPEISIIPPDQVLVYKSGAVLNVAVRLPMINSASFNDLVTEARLRPGPNQPWFEMAEIAIPIFNDEKDHDAAKVHCIDNLRCQRFSKMAVSQKGSQIISVPSGGAEAQYLSFELYCEDANCQSYSSFEATRNLLGERDLTITMRIKFHKDGEREIHCEAGRVDVEDLKTREWQTIGCKNPASKRV